MSLWSPLNTFLFPAKNYSGYDEFSYFGNLFWLPETKDISYKIPFLWFPVVGSNMLLILAHGNAADIGRYVYYKELAAYWKINVLLWEYPGYGPCKGTASAYAIDQHFDRVMDFVSNDLKWPYSNIIFYGHSIGTGPTCKMVAKLHSENNKVGGLILQSPYTSIRALARHFAGIFGWVAWERWDNLSEIRGITCPTLIIHGKKDNVIPYTHSSQLADASPSKNKNIIIYDYADHNYFKSQDLIEPVTEFLKLIKNDFQPGNHFNPTKYGYHTQ